MAPKKRACYYVGVPNNDIVLYAPILYQSVTLPNANEFDCKNCSTYVSKTPRPTTLTTALTTAALTSRTHRVPFGNARVPLNTLRKVAVKVANRLMSHVGSSNTIAPNYADISHRSGVETNLTSMYKSSKYVREVTM